jgi:hypothetical protein
MGCIKMQIKSKGIPAMFSEKVTYAKTDENISPENVNRGFTVFR